MAGLRERKKQRTKASIQREALRLFKKRGYDETTIEDIAAAADISPSTFFNYFPSKEDVVIYDEYDPQVFAALMADTGRPLGESILDAIEAMAGIFESDRDAIYERAKLSLEVPELRARTWEELEKAQRQFAAVMAVRMGRDAEDFEVRVVALALVGAAFEAALEWVSTGGRGSMLNLFKRALEAIDFNPMLEKLDRGGPRKT
ncbi:MAG TPA: TetR family transcriptional regulator [Candidatus Dormibacteraeota bacterium]|nr:TetR family transcriptional regulator [Candidatus Dormibacteraeota bacterium]